MKVAIAIILALGVIISLVVSAQVNKNRDRKREVFAFREQVRIAHEYHKQIYERLSGMDKYREQAQTHVAAISNEIVSVLSMPDAMSIVNTNWNKRPPMALTKKPAVSKPVAVPAATPDAKPAPPPALKKAPKAPLVDEMGREIPEGLEDIAEMEASRKPKEDPAPAAEAAPKAEAPVMVDEMGREAPMGTLASKMPTNLREQPSAASPAAGAGELAVAPEIIKEMKDHYNKAQAVLEKVEGRIQEASESIEQIATLSARVQASGSSTNAFKLIESGPTLVDSANALATSMPPLIDEIKVLPAKVTLLREKIEADRKRRKDEAAAAKLAADTEARRKAELERLSNPLSGKDRQIRNYNFKEVMVSVQELQQGLEFEDSKKLLIPVARRFEVMDLFMKWLVDSINKKPFGYGWKIGGTSFDITGASETGITVRGKEIPWVTIPHDKVIYIAQNYIQHLPTFGQEAAMAHFGAALFCKTFSMTGEAAVYQKTASDISKLVADEIDAVMSFDPLPISADPAR
jgi:hypothetical protein